MTSYIRRDATLVREAIEGTDGSPGNANELLYLMYAVLLRVKGVNVTGSDVHDAWAAHAEYNTLGSSLIMPSSELTPDQRALDEPFAEAIQRVARQLSA